MGLVRLQSFLRRHRRVGLDSNVFIYHVEAHPRYQTLTQPIFTWLEKPGSGAVTSTITMTELLVQPYRKLDEQKVNEFYPLLAAYPNLDWVAPGLEIANRTAVVRAIHGLRTPDALQAATAIHSGATGFVTNDSAFVRVTGFETLVLDSLL